MHEQNISRHATAKICENCEKFAANANVAPAIAAANSRLPRLLGHVRIVRARAPGDECMNRTLDVMHWPKIANCEKFAADANVAPAIAAANARPPGLLGHAHQEPRNAMAKNCENGENFAAAANFATTIAAADARLPGLLGHVRIVRARAPGSLPPISKRETLPPFSNVQCCASYRKRCVLVFLGKKERQHKKKSIYY